MPDIPAPSRAAISRIDPGSTVAFVVDYMGMRLAGRFSRVVGTIQVDLGEPERSSVQATIDVDSVEPSMAALGPVLRSTAGLDVAAYPEIRFESRRIERLDGRAGPARPGDRFAIHGEVVTKGERRPMVLEATLVEADEAGGVRVTARGTAKGLIADETVELQLDIVAHPASKSQEPAPLPKGAEAERRAPAAAPSEQAGGPTTVAHRDARTSNRPTPRRRASGAIVRILGMSGSLRRGSINSKLLEAAIEMAPSDMVIDRFRLDRIPLYNGDLETDGDPPPVRRLKASIREHDGLLIATPEYNHSIAAVTKNAIDWASRPPFDPPLLGKPVALMGATPGRSGARKALEHARVALAAAGARPLAEEVTVTRAIARFDAEGRLIDEETREAVRSLLEALRAAVLEQRARQAA